MTVRGIDIRVHRGEAGEVPAAAVVIEERPPGAGKRIELRVDEAKPSGPMTIRVWGGSADEHSVRAAVSLCLRRVESMKLSSIALPALGQGPGGLSPIASGKIMVQETIRHARNDAPNLRTVWLCQRDAGSIDAFEKAIKGYVKHFLDVLLWGPFVTVDAIIRIPRGIVLVKRSNPPFGLALPGGFVDYGESLEEAVRREALEETGLELRELRQFHTYSDPGRDPRFHTVTTVFSAEARGEPRAGDDAAAIRVIDPAEIEGLSFAFDHKQVLRDFLSSGH